MDHIQDGQLWEMGAGCKDSLFSKRIVKNRFIQFHSFFDDYVNNESKFIVRFTVNGELKNIFQKYNMLHLHTYFDIELRSTYKTDTQIQLNSINDLDDYDINVIWSLPYTHIFQQNPAEYENLIADINDLLCLQAIEYTTEFF